MLSFAYIGAVVVDCVIALDIAISVVVFYVMLRLLLIGLLTALLLLLSLCVLFILLVFVYYIFTIDVVIVFAVGYTRHVVIITVVTGNVGPIFVVGFAVVSVYVCAIVDVVRCG